MPLIIGQWELDNFSQKLPHFNTPTNLKDCYFYYYSKCTRINCPFRHESDAMGNEKMCLLWMQGKCTNSRCPDRHMIIRKNRNLIPCFWEEKDGGCKKPHCVFKHSNNRIIELIESIDYQKDEIIQQIRELESSTFNYTTELPTIKQLQQDVLIDVKYSSELEALKQPGNDGDANIETNNNNIVIEDVK